MLTKIQVTESVVLAYTVDPAILCLPSDKTPTGTQTLISLISV
jgi:hypothetical protein